jgi:hypothetical protein
MVTPAIAAVPTRRTDLRNVFRDLSSAGSDVCDTLTP